MRFTASQVAAVYDFDYLSLQARIRDVVDALVFFAADRAQPVDPDDIYSLKQPFVPDLERSVLLLDGYRKTAELTDAERHALPWLIRSQWLQIRLRGSRKVLEEHKLAFVLDGCGDVIDWLDREAPGFFRRLRLRQL